MKRRIRLFVLLCVAVWTMLAAAHASAPLPKPGPKDLCPVCGMLVSKYPSWVAIVVYSDGHPYFFDGPKDMFKYLHDVPRYTPGRRRETIAAMWVTDYYNQGKVEATKAHYVTGSDVLGPMGHELVPLETRADADAFLKDHKGRRILAFGDVTLEIAVNLDSGKF